MSPTPSRGRVVMLLTNPATYDQRPLKEAHALSAAGYSVTILAWDREESTQKDSQFNDGLLIKRMRVRAGRGTPFLTVPRLFLFYAWCVVRLLTMRSDVIHCHDVDTLPAGFAAKALKLARPRLVYDMHDLPEAFLRFFPLTSLTQRVFLALARKSADLVVIVNDRFIDHLVPLGFRRRKLVVVMNSPPSNEPMPKERHDPFRVLYYGWLGEERGVRLIMEALRGLDGITLTLAGRGELEPWVREMAKSNPSIKFEGWLPMEKLQPLIDEADLIPSLYEPRTKNAQLATPGKLLSALSLGIPVLVPSGSYQSELVEKSNCGIVVTWGDVGQVRDSFVRLSTDRRLYDELSVNARKAFEAQFSWEAMTARLASAYDTLLGHDSDGAQARSKK